MPCLAASTVKALLTGFEDLPAKHSRVLLKKLGKAVSKSDLDAWSGTSKSLLQSRLGAALREPLLKEQIEVITLSIANLDSLQLAQLLERLSVSCIDCSNKEVLMSCLQNFMSLEEIGPEPAVNTTADKTSIMADDTPAVAAVCTTPSKVAASSSSLQSTVEEGEVSEQVIFCPQGHNTEQTTCSTSRWGTCDVCNAKVYKGDFIHKCQPCNWWCCIVCSSKGARPPSPQPLVRQPTASGWPLQPPYEEIEEFQRLSSCQLNALAHIRRICKHMHEEALPSLTEKVAGIGYTEEDLQRCLDYIREEAPLIVHVNLEECAGKLGNDTHYRNQFETQTSGGLLDTSESKTRQLWETELFGDSYADASPFERPKYGVLNITQDPHGIRECAQYGKSYLQLQGVRLRTTLSAMDSGDLVRLHGKRPNPQLPHVWALPDHRLATVDYYAHVLLEYSAKELRAVLDVGARKEGPVHSKILRKYKEVQIHGEVALARNVSLIAVHTGQSPSKAALAKLSDTCMGAPIIPLHSTTSTSLPIRPPSKVGDEDGASSICIDHSQATLADTDASAMAAVAKGEEIDPVPEPTGTRGSSDISSMSAEEAKLAEQIEAISRTRSEEFRAQMGHLVP